MKIWKLLTLLSLAGSLLIQKPAKAVGIRGFFINSPQCSVKVYRRPTGPRDTLKTRANPDGLWVIATQNFQPPARIGETLYVEGGWNLGGKAKTFDVLIPSPKPYLDLHLNKFTACIRDVYDSSRVDVPLKAIYSLQGIAPCTTHIDTGYDQGFTFYYDVHVPFDTLQATPGRQGLIRLEKRRNDTTWYREIPFNVSRERFDAQLVKDTVYFPQHFTVFKDVGIDKILVPDSARADTIIRPGVVVRNYGTINQNPRLHCRIDNYRDSITRIVRAGRRDTFYFSPCTLRHTGIFPVTIYSVLPGDVNPRNDTLRDTIVVRAQVEIKEKELEDIVQDVKLIKGPSIVRGERDIVLNIEGDYRLYHISGKMAYKGKGNRFNTRKLPSGAYFLFLKPRGSNGLLKPEKVLILK